VKPVSTIMLIVVIIISLATSSYAQTFGPTARLDPRSFDPERDVDTDPFVVNFDDNEQHTEYGALIVQDIFTPVEVDDPYHPVRHGAVLTGFNRVAHAFMNPGTETETITLTDEQLILYVDEGAATLRAGRRNHNLSEGSFVIIPEGIQAVLVNSSLDPVSMYIISEPTPEGFTPVSDIVMVNERDVAVGGTTGHWAHMTKLIFGRNQGQATMNRLGVVYIDGKTFAQPHSHGLSFEDEVWISLTDNSYSLLGKKIYHLLAGTAYMVPNNGKTPHNNFNVSDKPSKLIWFNIRRPDRMDQEVEYEYVTLDPEPFDPEKDLDPELVMSDWRESLPQNWFGNLIVRPIFTPNEGDSMRPTKRGAVLKDLKLVARAEVLPRSKTIPSTLEGRQIVAYITDGYGTITAGGKTETLAPGSGVLIPEGLEFIMENGGTEILAMYLYVEPTYPGFVPRKDVLVREGRTGHKVAGGHWGNVSYQGGFFSWEDGFATIFRCAPAGREPMSIANPHASLRDSGDTIWVAVEGEIYDQAGKELRRLRPGMGFANLGDGRYYHAAINVTDKPIMLFWLRTATDDEDAKIRKSRGHQ